MRINEIENSNSYYHGSNVYLSPKTILTPRFQEYENEWGNTDFYKVLEKYRPINLLSHKESVFMVGDPDDIDLAGGGTEYIFTVKPLGPIQKHDMNWSSEISSLISEGYDINSKEIIDAANKYWNGTPHHDENVWEYLTTKALIISVEEF